MQFSLPYSEEKVEIRDFIPHKVAKEVNAAMYKGITVSQLSVSATKQELINEFGPKVMEEVDKLSVDEYKKKMEELKQDLIKSRMSLEGLSLANIESGNMVKVCGMVTKVGDDNAPSQKVFDEMAQQDYDCILENISKIENLPLGETTSTQ